MSQNEKILIENAVKLADKDDYQAAIDLLQGIESPENPAEIHYHLGVWHYQLNRTDASVRAFHQAAQYRSSPFAHRSLLNLASIYKRTRNRADQVSGFKYLLTALEMARQHNWSNAQEQTVDKMARYLLDLDLFDAINSAESGLDWVEFKKNLPAAANRDSILTLLSALLYAIYARNLDKTIALLEKGIQTFGADPGMVQFITRLQHMIIRKTAYTSLIDQQLRHEKEDLKRLIRIGSALSSELHLDKLLELVIDDVIEITNAERGFLMLADDDQLQFRIARNSQKGRLSEDNFKISQTVAKTVFKTGQPILIPDIGLERSWILTDSVVDLQLKSILGVPLRTSERTIGVIYVDNSIHSSEFGQREHDLLITLASQTSIAIENARLYEHLEELVDERTAELRQAHDELRKNLLRNIASKNKLIDNMEQHIRKIMSAQDQLLQKELLSYLNQSKSRVEEWVEFRVQFNQQYPGFLDHLLDRAPNLTQQEQKICALIRSGLSSSAIADTLYISMSTIETHRTHIRKKLKLPATETLNAFVKRLT